MVVRVVAVNLKVTGATIIAMKAPKEVEAKAVAATMVVKRGVEVTTVKKRGVERVKAIIVTKKVAREAEVNLATKKVEASIAARKVAIAHLDKNEYRRF